MCVRSGMGRGRLAPLSASVQIVAGLDRRRLRDRAALPLSSDFFPPPPKKRGEKKIAEAFQNFLKDAFPGLDVFRSSDAESIETAQGLYASILSALQTTEVM